MRQAICHILLLLPILLCGVTRTVSIDGTQQYTSIQAAVTASSSGDVVLVYPGTYVENINTSGRSITINSLYAQSPLQTYIDNTIINGNLNSCIKIISGETVTVNGFTIVNNPDHLFQYTIILGGGFNIQNNCHVYIKNCVVRDCFAKFGGGIWAANGPTVEISNLKIFSNQSLNTGGGLSVANNTQLICDILYPSSIYDNVAPVGMDVLVRGSTSQVNINLAMGSKAMNAPDSFFVLCYDNDIPATVSIAQSYFTFVNHDLFISPDGNDNSDGLSYATAKKTLRHALQVIQPGPDSNLTIHLAPGTYSHTANEQVLPLNLKQNVRIVGSGPDQTVIDGELIRGFFCGYYTHDIDISNIRFINGRASYSNPIDLLQCRDISLTNLKLSNNQCNLSSGIYLNYTYNVICDNIDIGFADFSADVVTLSARESGNVFMNNIISHDIILSGTDYHWLGLDLYESDVTLRNSIIANNSASDAYMLSYQNINQVNSSNNLDMNNILVTNNTITNSSWIYNPVYLQNRFQRMQINNCTFAGNSGSSGYSSIFGYADVRNCIFYNPQSAYELYLRNNISSVGIQADVSISNSLFRTISVSSDLPELVSYSENIWGGNPLFLGSVTDSLNVTDPEYYYLSAGSPCINTGTADTTGLNLPTTDLAGNQRIWNNRIDMGCYEYGAPPVANDNPEYPFPPEKIILSAYPNPVYVNGNRGGFTFIEFTLPEKAKQDPVIDIYNLKGQKVRSIHLTQSYQDMLRKAGLSKYDSQGGEFYSSVFDCRNDRGQKLSSGIYLIRISADERHVSGRITIIK